MKASTSLKQKLIAIDSAERPSGRDSDAFTVPISLPHDNDFDKIAMLECNVPKSYYMWDFPSIIRLKEDTGSTDLGVVIPGYRNYTASQLSLTLAISLTLASAGGPNAFTYNVAFDDGTGKFTITASSGEFHLEFQTDREGDLLAAKYLGWEAGAITPTSSSSVLVSANVINLQRYDVIYVHCSLADNSGDDIIGRVYPSNSPYLDSITYQSPAPKLMSCGLSNNQTNSANISLTDKDNNRVNLNGQNWNVIVSAFRDDDKGDI